MIRRKNKNNNTLIHNQQPKIDNVNKNNDNNTTLPAYENHRNINVGPSKVGRTYYMLKILEKKGNKRPIHIITRSPNQNPNYKSFIDIKPIDKYRGSVINFDDMIGA